MLTPFLFKLSILLYFIMSYQIIRSESRTMKIKAIQSRQTAEISSRRTKRIIKKPMIRAIHIPAVLLAA